MTPRVVLELAIQYGRKVIGLPEFSEKKIAYRRSVLDKLTDKYGMVGLVPFCEFDEKVGNRKKGSCIASKCLS